MRLPRKEKKKYKKMYISYRFLFEDVKLKSKNVRITDKDSVGFIGECIK